MPRLLAQTRASHSNAETAETGQSAHFADNAFDRRQKWTPHVCSRVFRRAGLYPKSPANSLTRTQAAEPSLTSIGEGDASTALVTRDEARCLAEKFARKYQASWRSGARRDNVTPASQPSSHPASRLKSCDLCGVPMTAARWCRDAALVECLSHTVQAFTPAARSSVMAGASFAAVRLARAYAGFVGDAQGRWPIWRPVGIAAECLWKLFPRMIPVSRA
jgi:hypothetical protein